MNQSTVIIGALLLMFVVFITTRGDLPKWLQLFQATHHTAKTEVNFNPPPAAKSGGSGSGGIDLQHGLLSSQIPGFSQAEDLFASSLGI